jgi:hypothetical protein
MEKGFIGVMGSFIMRNVITGNFAIRNVVGVCRPRDRLDTPTYSFPEENAFCSEALDENASVLRRVWNILFGRTEEKKSVYYMSVYQGEVRPG